MKVIRKFTTVNNGAISFEELNDLNNETIEILIFKNDELNQDKITEQKNNILKFKGCIDSGFYDTSEHVDKLIYGA